MNNIAESQPTSPNKHLSHVREVIRQKAWYGLNPETGLFNWDLSIRNISDTLGLSSREPQVKEAFASAFTPNCLTKVQIKLADGSLSEQSLIEAVKKLGIEQFIWTVGDSEWQLEKYKRSGASQIIESDHYQYVPENKLFQLRTMLSDLKARKRGKNMHVLVADDKDKHTNEVKAMIREFEEKPEGGPSFTIGDYFFNLDDENANAQAFYNFVQKYQEENRDDEVVIIFDFDGVVADTDGVLFGPAAEIIAGLYEGP